MRHLGVELKELDDWNCCGATAYMSVDEREAAVLAARNLAIAEKSGSHDLLTPCSACYLVLNKAKHNMADFPEIRERGRLRAPQRQPHLRWQYRRPPSPRRPYP